MIGMLRRKLWNTVQSKKERNMEKKKKKTIYDI